MNNKAFFFTLLLSAGALFGNADKQAKMKEIQTKINSLNQQSNTLKLEMNKHKAELMLLQKSKQVDEMLNSLVAVPAKSPRKILVYSRTTGFRHSSIEFGAAALKLMGEKTGAYSVVHTEDEKMINATELAKHDAVLMLNTTNNPISNPKARKAFEDFLAQKKGLIGIHAATDCHRNWPNYLEAMGGVFDGHPWSARDKVTLYNECPDHVCAKMVPQGYVIQDEIYQYKDDKHFTREKMRVLLSLDLTGPNMMKKGMKRKDNDYPVSWLRSHTGSRIFYTNLGHNESTFWDKVAMQHILTGIQYACGDIEADATPSAKLGKFPKPIK